MYGMTNTMNPVTINADVTLTLINYYYPTPVRLLIASLTSLENYF